MRITSKDYHDYVIKDGKFIGEFEQMYQNVDNPWPETKGDMDNNKASLHAKRFFQNLNITSALSLGGGTGDHLAWFLQQNDLCNSCNVEISSTACKISRDKYPSLKVENKSILSYLENAKLEQFDLIIMREIIWYILSDIDMIYQNLKLNFPGKYILVELTFPEDQKYGREYFFGIDNFLSKFEFQIIEKLVEKKETTDDYGYLMVIGKI